ncbi:Ig-like domain-containing protein [Pedobacter endophyticus]|uniref:Gliding motility-associated C-terminal domain-containing protein n=1 Tax=Pedobacter endophyticus TaxID=2789740 RepID=A0A7U3Q3G0_9SPHI|nr:Ig-like domain-containing protein [Pedobacter endophyticus]QPH37832.1 gliding motility-associated C-terminal domain-containing protein [Pedobacter endophyticus]
MKKFFTKESITFSVILLFLSLAFPALAQYTQTNLETGGLYTAMAKDRDNNLYITRVKSGSGGAIYEVVKYTYPNLSAGASTQVVYTGLTHGYQEFPWGLAIASNGDVYISTDFTDGTKNGQIIKVTKASNYTASSEFLSGRFFTALAVDASDNLYATEYNLNSGKYDVRKYTTTGAPGTGTLIYSSLSGSDGAYPTGLCVAADNAVYVAAPASSTTQGEIVKITSSGTTSQVSANQAPTALAVDAQNNLYASEKVGTGYQVTKYSTSGATSVIVTGLHENGFYYPWGIAEINGNYYVIDGDDLIIGGAVLILRPMIAAPSTPILAAASDSGNSNTDKITNVTLPTFSGTAEAASTVKLYEGATLLGTATATGGSWSITLTTALTAGVHKITATATNASDVTSPLSGELSITVDNVAPVAPSTPSLAAASDSGISSSDGITSATTVVFTGAAESGSTVVLYDTDGTTVLGSNVATGGNWSITTTALSSGVHSITAKARDVAGNTSTASSNKSITIDTTAPLAPSTPDLLAASDSGISSSDNITNNTTPTFSGTAESGSVITLYDSNGTTVLGTAVATGGNWSITSSALGSGAHNISAKSTDVAGNVSPASTTLAIVIDTTSPVAPSTPVCSAGNPTKNQTPTFTGTSESGATVNLYDGTTQIGSSLASGINWSIVSSTLAEGVHSITAKAVDAAGNVSASSSALALTIDLTAPVVTGITAGATYTAPVTKTITFNEGTATLNGTPFASGSNVSTVNSYALVVADAAGNVTNVNFSIINATPVITWANPSGIIYGTALSATQLNATANVPGSFVYTPASGTVLAAGTQTLTVDFTPTDAATYNPTSKTVNINVSKATPVITWANPSGIIYGTALSATQLNATSNVPGSFVYTPASGTVLAVGLQTLTVDFTPTDAANYNATSKTVSINVSKATPVITWANPSAITYGTALSATQLNATSNVPGNFVYTPASGTVLAVGLQTLTVDFTPTDAANYSVTSKTVSINVGKATPVITWANPSAITYGTALSATQLNATSNVPGSFTYTPASGTILGAGMQTLTVNFTPTDAVNYNATSKTVSINVGKATPVITWANPADITYGTALSATQLNATSNVAGSFTYTPASGTVLGAGMQTLTVDFTPTDAANYSATSKTVSINVGKATPVITWANPLDITYGTALSATQLNATSNVAGSFTYTPASGTVLGAGTQTLTVNFTPTNATNYSATSKTVSINVGKATPIITWADPADITYGTALLSTQLNATSNVAGSFVYTPASGTVLAAGMQALTVDFTPTDAANYSATSKTVSINVGKATPVITWANPSDITYGTALSATQLNATSNVAGSFTYTPASGIVLGAGVQTLTVNFTPTDAANYAATSKTVSINVGKATPVVTWANPSAITYGTALSATQLNATANIPGSFTYTPAVGTVLAAGMQALTVDFTPTDAANYSAISKTVSINVGKATPVITWANPLDITYGTALSATELNATSNVAGSFTYTPASGTVLAAGTQALKVDFTPTDATNYTATSKTVSINVGKAIPVITWANPSAITYGTALSATQLNATSNVAGNFVYTPASGTVLAAGTQTLTVDFTPTDGANYSSTSKLATINVVQKQISGTFTVSDKVYDGSTAATILTRNLTGVLTADQADVNLAAGTAAFANANAGTAKSVVASGMILTGAKAGNYVLSGVANASANISAKPIVITADAKTKVYGDADPAFTYSLAPNSLVGSDAITGALNRTAGENVGNYTINLNTLSASANYAITFNAASFQITQRPLLITINDKTKPYLAANPTFTATYSGFVGTENNSVFTTPLTIASVATTTSSVGTYPITGSGAAAANYNISYKQGTLTIAKTTQSITFNPLATKLVTDAPFVLQATASSGLSVTYISSNTNVARITNGNQVQIVGIGTTVITASQAGDSNFEAANPVTQNFTVIDNPPPVLSISSDKGNSISKGETARLTAIGALTYQWSNAEGIINGQNSAVLTIRPSATTTYTVTGFNQYGRSSSQTFTIEVRADFQVLDIHNVVTPNGDGKNDTWKVENIDMYPNNLVKIFDRAGKLVFEMKGYDNSWGGTYKGGVLPEGTYYYIIDFGKGIGVRKGFITIVGNQ